MLKISPILLLVVSAWSAWNPESRPFAGSIKQILPLSSGVMALASGSPYLSTDQGIHWTEARGNLPSGVLLVNAVSRGDTVVGYGAGTIWRSCDAGASWAKWDEGFTPTLFARAYLDFIQGDTTLLLSVMSDMDGTYSWKRTPHSDWVRIDSTPELYRYHAAWNGQSFLVASTEGSVELGPNGTKWQPAAPEAFGLNMSLTVGNEVWAFGSKALKRSRDNGKTWDSVGTVPTWVNGLGEVEGIIVTIGQDSMNLFMPANGVYTNVRAKQPEPYGMGILKVGSRWVFLGEQQSWTSIDSGKSWTSLAIDGAGLAGKLVRTSKGWLMQDVSVRTKGWISNDLESWSTVSLPQRILWDGLDTAAGGTYAFGDVQLWTLEDTGWSQDSVKLKDYGSIASTIAYDGNRVWLSSSNGLHGRSANSRSWELLDSSTAAKYSSPLRHWKGALWKPGREWNEEANVLYSRDDQTGTWASHALECYQIMALEPTPNVLWIGTDMGLYRTTDGKSFELMNTGSPEEAGMVMALAARGDTVAVTQSSESWFSASTQNSVSTSFDGGITWSREPDLYAMQFLFDDKGLLASMSSGGFARWGAVKSGVESKARQVQGFQWTSGQLKWSDPGAKSIEIIDARGRILSEVDVSSGVLAIPLQASSTFRIARLKTDYGVQTIKVPPLR